DHSPSYLWNSATWEISEALLPHLPTVLGGPDAWDADETIRRSIEIRHGVIRNPNILSFQHRSPDFPQPASLTGLQRIQSLRVSRRSARVATRKFPCRSRCGSFSGYPAARGRKLRRSERELRGC
ncbi:MAG: hypothetical protein ACRDQB_05365, partial [Thermocrispum sp.]